MTTTPKRALNLGTATDTERAFYTKGYTAGRKEKALAEREFWEAVYMAALPNVLTMGWDDGDGESIRTPKGKAGIAAEVADAALAAHKRRW